MPDIEVSHIYVQEIHDVCSWGVCYDFILLAVLLLLHVTNLRLVVVMGIHGGVSRRRA